jgi:hypothetical protein
MRHRVHEGAGVAAPPLEAVALVRASGLPGGRRPVAPGVRVASTGAAARRRRSEISEWAQALLGSGVSARRKRRRRTTRAVPPHCQLGVGEFESWNHSTRRPLSKNSQPCGRLRETSPQVASPGRRGPGVGDCGRWAPCVEGQRYCLNCGPTRRCRPRSPPDAPRPARRGGGSGGPAGRGRRRRGAGADRRRQGLGSGAPMPSPRAAVVALLMPPSGAIGSAPAPPERRPASILLEESPPEAGAKKTYEAEKSKQKRRSKKRRRAAPAPPPKKNRGAGRKPSELPKKNAGQPNQASSWSCRQNATKKLRRPRSRPTFGRTADVGRALPTLRRHQGGPANQWRCSVVGRPSGTNCPNSASLPRHRSPRPVEGNGCVYRPRPSRRRRWPRS